MKISFLKILIIFIVSLIGSGICRGELLTDWNDYKTYRPIPVVFVHGMNSSPEAWGFLINPGNESITGYTGTSQELQKYFDRYLDHAVDANGNPIIDPNTGETIPLIYLEPFNYQFNTFDSIKWNAWEGWDNNGLQYPDSRIQNTSIRFNRDVLKKFIGELFISSSSPGSGILGKYQTDKLQLVAHSLGGVVSRYYLHNTKSGGANVLQLTMLGSPHRGTVMATIGIGLVGRPVTDIQNMGRVRRWTVIIFSNLIKDIPVDRYPAMIDEVQRFSDFMGDLNKPHNIPMGVRHYCIADALSPCGWISWLPLSLTDGFIELDSALGVSPTEQLPCPDLEEYKPKGYLPKYKGKLLTGKENWHIKLTSNAGEILKAIDDTKPVIEVTELMDSQNRFLWRVGQWPDYFDVPTDGKVKVHGLCRKEYLPADTYINIGFRKAGQADVNWLTESSGLTTDPTQARQWLLQPSDSWVASNTNSPVAEFEVEIDFPIQEVTHSIVVQATNPAGIKSDPVEVVEKTHYIYAVGKDEDGGAKFLCLDGPTSFADGMSAVVSEFNLVDEQGNKINAKPLDIAASGNTIWVSFDNKKIYSYNRDTMKPIQLTTGKYYYTTTGAPDGLYYDGNLQYCSSVDNKIYRLNLSNGTETDLGVIKRPLLFDGDSTTIPSEIPASMFTALEQEYVRYSPTGISQNYLCSGGLGKISRKSENAIRTMGNIWTDEQSTPSPCIGMIEVPDYLVPGGPVLYLSCSNGNVYKVRFESKTNTSTSVDKAGYVTKEEKPDGITYSGGGMSSRKYANTWWLALSGKDFAYSYPRTFRGYLYFTAPPSFEKVIAFIRSSFSGYKLVWVNGQWVLESVPISDVTFSICSFNESWPTEQKFNAPIINQLSIISPDGTPIVPSPGIPWPGLEQTFQIRDVTGLVPTSSFWLTTRYNNEGQTFGISSFSYPYPEGYVRSGGVEHSLNNLIWNFLTSNGSLIVLDTFTMPFTIVEGIAIGPRVKIRIEPEFLLLNVGISREFKVNGKGTYTWESSDETVAEIEGVIPQIDGVGEAVSVKAVGMGESTLSVRDALGNIAYASIKVE